MSKPFQPAHNKKYDVFVDGKPLRMRVRKDDKNGGYDYYGTSHALAIYYMCTVPNEKEIPILEASIARRKAHLTEMRLKATTLTASLGAYEGETSFAEYHKLHTLRVDIRYGVGEIALMEERLKDVQQYLAGNWGYEVYERTD